MKGVPALFSTELVTMNGVPALLSTTRVVENEAPALLRTANAAGAALTLVPIPLNADDPFPEKRPPNPASGCERPLSTVSTATRGFRP